MQSLPSCPTLRPHGRGSSVRGFSRPEHWRGLPGPPPGHLPCPGVGPVSPAAAALQVGSLPTEPSGKPRTGLEPCKTSYPESAQSIAEHWTQQTPSWINPKRYVPRHIMIELGKPKAKRENLNRKEATSHVQITHAASANTNSLFYHVFLQKRNMFPLCSFSFRLPYSVQKAWQTFINSVSYFTFSCIPQ